MFTTLPQTSGLPQADKILLLELQKTLLWETKPSNHSHLENEEKQPPSSQLDSKAKDF